MSLGFSVKLEGAGLINPIDLLIDQDKDWFKASYTLFSIFKIDSEYEFHQNDIVSGRYTDSFSLLKTSIIVSSGDGLRTSVRLHQAKAREPYRMADTTEQSS